MGSAIGDLGNCIDSEYDGHADAVSIAVASVGYGEAVSTNSRVTVSGPSQSVHLGSDKDIHLGVISSSGTDSFGAISAAENSTSVNDVRTVVALRCNASDVAGNSKDIRCGSTLSGVAGHMGAFSATNFSEIINHHGSLSGIGSGDFPPLCPFIKVASGKQKAVSKASTPSGEANACHYAPTKHVFNAITGVRFPDVQEDVSLSCVIPALSQPVRSVSSSGKVGKSQEVTEDVLLTGDAKASQNWRSLFVNRPKSCTPLVFSNPARVDGKVIINPPSEAVEEGLGIWEGCLVGQFFDKRLPLHVVKTLVERLWGKHEMPEISTTDNGLYIFWFMDDVARDWVLENGPWYFFGRPIILRRWKPGMEMLNVQITSLPIWVKFFNIPLEYWTVTSLGYIASAVGIPLHLDTLTENHSRLSFARICIEVDVNCAFPKSALLNLGNGKYSTIRIEYPWVPQKCSHCKIFGHSHLRCQFVKVNVESGRSTCPAKSHVNATGSPSMSDPVNVVADIVNHTTTPKKAGKDTVYDIPTRPTGNTFECLAICEDSGSLEIDVEQGPSRYGSPTTPAVSDASIVGVISTLSGVGPLDSSKPDLSILADYLDTSPNYETFKHIKRVDELGGLIFFGSKQWVRGSPSLSPEMGLPSLTILWFPFPFQGNMVFLVGLTCWIFGFPLDCPKN